MGLAGMEILNLSKTTIEQFNYYKYLADKYNLITTCGSDFHREDITPNIGIQNNFSDEFIKIINKRK
jgi:hypothetical protein